MPVLCSAVTAGWWHLGSRIPTPPGPVAPSCAPVHAWGRPRRARGQLGDSRGRVPAAPRGGSRCPRRRLRRGPAAGTAHAEPGRAAGAEGVPPPPADLQPLRLQEGRTPLTQPSGHSPALRDTPVPWAGCLGTVLRSARHGATLFPGAWPLCSASTAASHQEVRAALAEHRAGC